MGFSDAEGLDFRYNTNYYFVQSIMIHVMCKVYKSISLHLVYIGCLVNLELLKKKDCAKHHHKITCCHTQCTQALSQI